MSNAASGQGENVQELCDCIYLLSKTTSTGLKCKLLHIIWKKTSHKNTLMQQIQEEMYIYTGAFCA